MAGEVIAGPGPSPAAPATAAQAFELLGERWPVFSGITYSDVGYTGRVLDPTSDARGESQRADLGVM